MGTPNSELPWEVQGRWDLNPHPREELRGDQEAAAPRRCWPGLPGPATQAGLHFLFCFTCSKSTVAPAPLEKWTEGETLERRGWLWPWLRPLAHDAQCVLVSAMLFFLCSVSLGFFWQNNLHKPVFGNRLAVPRSSGEDARWLARLYF